MPFTPTHVLAVVPIGYRWPRALPFSAVVIGSMVPDWPLFLPIGPDYKTTHSFIGIITACVPLGFALYAFFQRVLKRPLLELLPQSLRQMLVIYLNSPATFRPEDLIRIAVAVAMGAITHIVWDAFTHQDRWGTELLPVLNSVVLTMAGLDVRGYKLLQHGSSAVGIPILILCALAWLRKQRPHPVPALTLPQSVRSIMIILIISVPLSLGALTVAKLIRSPMTPDLLNRAVFDYVTQTGFGLILLLACYGVLFYPLVRIQRRRRPES